MSYQSPEKRKQVWEKFGRRCWYCNKKLPFDKITLDHLQPKSAGGTNRFDNFRPACVPCNQVKGDRPWWEFVKGCDQSPTGHIRKANGRGFRNIRKGYLRSKMWVFFLEENS